MAELKSIIIKFFQMRKLILILNIFMLISCSNDDEAIPNIENIYGKWEKTEIISAAEIDLDSNYSYSLKQELNLNRDNSFKWLTYFINSESEEIIGYKQMEVGTFSQNGNILSFNLDRFEPQQNSESGSYTLSTLENLVMTDQNITMNYNFKLLNTNKTLLFDFPNCEPDTTCPADMELIKVE